MKDYLTMTDFELVRDEIEGIDLREKFNTECEELHLQGAILVSGIIVKINADHPEITATIIEAILESNVTIQENEKIHNSELEYSRGCGNKCAVRRAN